MPLSAEIGKPPPPAQTSRVSVTDRNGQTVVLYEASYALVIGAGDYAEGSGWPDLPGVADDMKAVSEALRRQGFEVETLPDPDHETLRPALESFVNRHGLAPNNRLLIYFAGHGHTLRQSYGEQMGYLVPTDAPHPSRDRPVFLARALSMDEVEVLARKIQAKHALFLFDSCFAGTIFTLERKGEASPSIQARVGEPVRFFITAGKADESVPDVSVFRRQLVAALEGEADLYSDGYVTGMELGEFLYNKVVNYTRGKQHPQYGKIRRPGLDRGDFVFRLPPPEPPEMPPLPVPDETEFKLDDLKERAEAIEAAQKEWAAWQGRMQTAFEAVQAVAARPLPGVDKVQAWQRFLDAYAEDNPYSLDDEALRARANEELTRWQSAPVTVRQPLEPQPAARGRKPGERLEQSIAGVIFAQRYIPKGSFLMGSPGGPNGEPGRNDDETPHQVTLTRGFWMLETEVTQKQWERLMGTRPFYFANCGAECPVETVSWYDAVAFANKMSEQTGVDRCYEVQGCTGKVGSGCAAGGTLWCTGSYKCNSVAPKEDCAGWRLPTEAEWEYAARAKTKTPYWSGKDLPADHNCGGGRTVGVRSFDENPWGLYEVYGNVWEWVWDWSGVYPTGSVQDPVGPTRGSSRVLRGGSWINFARHCRSALRYAGAPSGRYHDVGFRLVRTAYE